MAEEEWRRGGQERERGGEREREREREREVSRADIRPMSTSVHARHQQHKLTQTQISNFELTPHSTSLSFQVSHRGSLCFPKSILEVLGLHQQSHHRASSFFASNISSTRRHFFFTISSSLPLLSSFLLHFPSRSRFRTDFPFHFEYGPKWQRPYLNKSVHSPPLSLAPQESAPVAAALDNTSWCKFRNP